MLWRGQVLTKSFFYMTYSLDWYFLGNAQGAKYQSHIVKEYQHWSLLSFVLNYYPASVFFYAGQSYFLLIPITPQATRPPAFPVVKLNSWPPFPRSSTPSWTCCEIFRINITVHNLRSGEQGSTLWSMWLQFTGQILNGELVCWPAERLTSCDQYGKLLWLKLPWQSQNRNYSWLISIFTYL